MTSLDEAYANGPYIPGADTYPKLWIAQARSYRAALGERSVLNQSYGPSERQVLDLFHPKGDSRGLMIFVHGGYWRAFDGKSWSHLAQGAVERGWTVAMPTYDLCPDVQIAQITQQIARAVHQIADLVPGPMALAGHSAGGHLVARMLAPGMIPARVLDRITHVMPISPLSELEPLISTKMNDDFAMDVAMARAESPVFQPKPTTEVTVWVGADERPAFLEQAQSLVDDWECKHVVAPERHHFNVIEDLADPESEMIRRLLSPQHAGEMPMNPL